MNFEDLSEKVNAMISRGRLTGASGEKPLRTLQVELLANDVRDDVEHMEPYGFTSEPHTGSEVVAASLAGSRRHTIVLTVSDRKYRLTGLKTGEVAIFDDLKRKVILTREGIVIDGAQSPIKVKTAGDVSIEGAAITIKGNTIALTAAGALTLSGSSIGMQSAVSTASGSFSATGDIKAGSISLQHHTHTGDSGGNTSEPR